MGSSTKGLASDSSEMAMSTPRSNRFAYAPLNYKRKEIRLLQIQPAVDASSPIHVYLNEHVNIASHVEASTRWKEEKARITAEGAEADQISSVFQEYREQMHGFTALSYTWGPESPTRDILVTGEHGQGWFSVRENLFEFLKMRRQRESPAFWIDQICIDQGNTEEKNHQVNQMAEIYTHASTVEVWLGPEFDGSDEMMDLFSDAANDAYAFARHSNREEKLTEEDFLAMIAPFQHFNRLSYWERLWVIQELVLGNDFSILLGSKSLPWKHWLEGWTMTAWNINKGKAPAQPHISDVDKMKERLRWISSFREQRGTLAWASVVDMVQDLKCSDSRDRVFGILGMVDPNLRFPPDYSMHPQDILLQILTQEVQLESSQHPHESDELFGYYCIQTAGQYLVSLEDEQNRIDPAAIRRHLLEILPKDAIKFIPLFPPSWQLRLFLRYEIPNVRSWAWRRIHSSVNF